MPLYLLKKLSKYPYYIAYIKAVGKINAACALCRLLLCSRSVGAYCGRKE